MNKQYLMLNLESDTFKGMKADFNELLQQLLEKLFAGRIADGSISMKLSVSLTETYSETRSLAAASRTCSRSRKLRLMKQLSTLKLFRKIATVPCRCVILCAMTALIAIPAPVTIAMAATSGSRR